MDGKMRIESFKAIEIDLADGWESLEGWWESLEGPESEPEDASGVR
jgi:hypothetical protein